MIRNKQYLKEWQSKERKDKIIKRLNFSIYSLKLRITVDSRGLFRECMITTLFPGCKYKTRLSYTHDIAKVKIDIPWEIIKSHGYLQSRQTRVQPAFNTSRLSVPQDLQYC